LYKAKKFLYLLQHISMKFYGLIQNVVVIDLFRSFTKISCRKARQERIESLFC